MTLKIDQKLLKKVSHSKLIKASQDAGIKNADKVSKEQLVFAFVEQVEKLSKEKGKLTGGIVEMYNSLLSDLGWEEGVPSEEEAPADPTPVEESAEAEEEFAVDESAAEEEEEPCTAPAKSIEDGDAVLKAIADLTKVVAGLVEIVSKSVVEEVQTVPEPDEADETDDKDLAEEVDPAPANRINEFAEGDDPVSEEKDLPAEAPEPKNTHDRLKSVFSQRFKSVK